MKVLLVCDPQNTFVGTLRRFKRDGDEFLRQAGYAADFYDDAVVFELPKGKAMDKRIALFRYLKNTPLVFDRVMFFCHGHKHSLNRRMVGGRDLQRFAAMLKNITTFRGSIVFFSCNTGKLANGFAAKIAYLTQRDVMAHTTRGHTTINPYKVFMRGISGRRDDLWPSYGGVRLMKKRLKASKSAPFEVVEEVMY